MASPQNSKGLPVDLPSLLLASLLHAGLLLSFLWLLLLAWTSHSEEILLRASEDHVVHQDTLSFTELVILLCIKNSHATLVSTSLF